MKHSKKRVVSYICILTLMFNLIHVPVFSLPTIPTGDSIWKEVNTNLSSLTEVEWVATSSNKAYLIGPDQSSGDPKIMYSTNMTSWSSRSLDLSNVDSIHFFDYIGSDIYLSSQKNGQYSVKKYDGSSSLTTVLDGLSSPVIAGVETQRYYSSPWYSGSEGHMVFATDSGSLYEVGVNASGYALKEAHEDFISAGIEDMTYYNGKYIVLDKSGTVHTGSDFDLAWETDALSTKSQKITTRSSDQYMAGSDGGTTEIFKGSGSYTVTRQAQSNTNIDIGDFDYVSGIFVLTGKNIDTGKAYIVTSSDGSAWEQETVKTSDDSEATVKMLDALYKSGILYAISDTGQVFKRVPKLIVTMSNPYNVGSTSVTLNGYAQTGGTSVSSKGIEVTLAADTSFSSATKYASTSYNYPGSSSTSISATATSLSQNTDYIARAYAENEIGMSYSDTISFTTDKVRGITLLPESIIEESNINGMQIVMNLDSDTFADTSINPANLTLNNFPTGTTVDSVDYIDSRKATIVLAFDYDNNIENGVSDANISIAGSEVTSNQQWDSNDITIYDEYETPRALVNGLGGAKGFGEHTMGTQDDFFETVDLTSVFPDGVEFGSGVYTQVDVNINGALHFGNIGDSSHRAFTPTGIEEATSPIIAPFWTDIGVHRPAQGITNEYDGDGNLVGTSTGSNRVYYDLDTVNKIFTVTWDDVSAYNTSTTGAAAFQVRLHNIGGDNMSIEIIYENLEYGGSSGAARMGWSTGDNPSPGGTEGVDYYEFPASGDADAIVLLPNSRGPSGQVGTYQSSLVDGVVTNVLADNNNIVGMTISSGTLAPEVNSAITGYSATVSSSVESITLTPTLESAEATMTVGGSPLESGATSDAISLTPGINEISIVVTAQDDSQKTYTVEVIRQTPDPFQVVFNANGGSAVADASAYAGETIDQPVSPRKAGYVFDGWYQEASLTSPWDFDTDTLSQDTSLYAKWSAIDYEVTYNANGADAGTPPIDGEAYNINETATALDNTGSLIKSGFKFDGWNTAADGSGTTYQAEDTFTIEGDTALFAKWTALPTMTVTYSGNGHESGTVPSDNGAYLQGADVNVLGNSGGLARTGYEFVGWTISDTGSGSVYQKNDVYEMGSSDITLYAKWTALPTYTVTYMSNGSESGSLPVDSAQYLEGQSVRVLDKGVYLQKTDYTFVGWNTSPDGKGTHYDLEETFNMPAENTTLYAEWELIPTYRVTYDGNGSESGSVPKDDNDYVEGAGVSIQGNAGDLAKTGFKFTGWNTNAGGSGDTYQSGDTLTMGSQPVSLYAQWEALPTYTVTYNDNNAESGTPPSDDNNYYATSLVTTQGNPGGLARYGYTFDGWSTSANGTGSKYKAGQSFVMGSGNETLYAVWTPLPRYAILYNDNGSDAGSLPVNTTSYLDGETATVLNNTGNLTKAGYAFAGWNTSSDGQGTNYTSGSEIQMGAENLTLYANWNQLPTYDVTYYGNGSENGSVPVDETSYLEGDPLLIQGNSGHLLRYGYKLIGWNTSSDLEGTFYKIGDRIAVGNTDIDLYAHWTPLPTYTVTYDDNDAEAGQVPQDQGLYLSGESVTIQAKSDQLVRTGYTFDGWTTAQDGSGSVYEADDTLEVTDSNVTLYAKWTALPTYQITYDGNGHESGLVPSDSNDYLENADVTIQGNISDLAKTGYLFAGWNTSADGTGKTLLPGLSAPMTDSDVTLYAKWVLAPRYAVIYEGNGHDSGKPPIDNNAYLSGAQAIALGSGRQMTKEGYVFSGWNGNSEGTGASHPVSSAVEIADVDVTLYAQWDLGSYTLYYNPVQDVTSPSAVTLKYGALLEEPSDPNNPDYILTGWYYDEALSTQVDFTSDTMPPSDLTIYAKWIDSDYTLSFEDGYNVTSPSAIEVRYGELLYEPDDPQKSGYTFSGWYFDEDLTHSVSFTTDTMPSNDLTLYAKWGVNPYMIHYDAGSGVTAPTSAMADYLTQIPEPTAPVREGYTFDGWYYDADLENPVDFGTDTMPAEDLTLHAKWQINTYSVELDYGYDVTSGPAITVTYGEKVDPGVPERSGYNFVAWYKEASLENIWDVLSDLMPAADITLYAKWSMVTDVDLADLKVDGYDLDKAFSPGETEYTVYDVIGSQVDVRAYTDPSQFSTVLINDQAVDINGWMTVDLEIGMNTFNIKVTAQDGITTKNYTLNVYRLNDEAVLESIKAFNGSEISGYDPDVKAYDLGITTLSRMTIQAQAYNSKPLQGIEINGESLNSEESKSIDLDMGLNTIEILVTAEDGTTVGTYTLKVERVRKPSGSSSSSSEQDDTPPSNIDDRENVTVIVNGKERDAGTKTISEANGRKSVTVDVVRTSIENEIISALEDPEKVENAIVVPISDEADDVKVGLTGDIIKLMEDNAFDLTINSGNAGYKIPAKEFEIVNVARALNVEESELVEIKVDVSIENVSDDESQLIRQNLDTKINMMSTPVRFRVEATAIDRDGNSKTVEVKKFKEFVERSIVLPESVEQGQITTAVLYEDDGTYTHIPTQVQKQGDRYVAVINSLTNSVYTVIWNQVTFEDVKDHWSEDLVNDLGSRLVISGKSDSKFDPDGTVTRAEFATMIVRGLGILRKDQSTASYSDVKSSDWFAKSVAAAEAYALISGYPDGSFKPQSTIQRQEAFAVAYKAMELGGYTGENVLSDKLVSQFLDSDQVSNWAIEATGNLLMSGVISGDGDLLKPKESITRAEAAALIRNILVECQLINK